MSEGRHHHASSLRHAAGARSRAQRRRRRRVAVALTAVVACLSGGAVAWGVVGRQPGTPSASASASVGCVAPQRLRVAASTEYVGALTSLADRLAAGTAGPAAPCIDLAVVAATAGAEGSSSIGTGIAAVLAAPGALAGFSAAAAQAGLTANEPTTVATTVAVVAMPQTLVAAAGWSPTTVTWSQIAATLVDPNAWATLGRPELGTFTVSLSDPAVSAAVQADLVGLAAGALGRPLPSLAPEDLSAVPVQAALFGLDRQVTRTAASPGALLDALTSSDGAGELAKTTSVVFLDEQSVWSFNAARPATPLVALYPQDGAVRLPVSWMTLAGAGVEPAQQAAATQLGAYLAGADGQAFVGEHGWRRIDGQPSASLTTDNGVAAQVTAEPVSQGTATVLAIATGGWKRIEHPGRFLAVLDVSGSMSEVVPGTGRTRLQFAQDAAVQRMCALPRGGQVGLWEFSTKLDGDQDYRELVPVGKISAVLNGRPRLDVLTDAVNGLVPQADTGLYDTVLAAFRSMRTWYQQGEPNDIVLVTDGRNDDPGSIDLPTLLATIAAEQDPANPVRVLSIAYGTDADLDALTQIATATGGAVYDSPNPAAIGAAFFQALAGR